MPDPPTRAIDSEGVSLGRDQALVGLVDARGDSVLSFCLELDSDHVAPQAAAEAMARFRSALELLGAGNDVDAEVLLLAATRHAGAAAADLDRLWSGARIQHRDPPCESMPTMLAARATGQLSEADLERVGRHLWRCEGCRLVEAAFNRAEQAYRNPAAEPEQQERAMMLDALQAAGPAAAGAAGGEQVRPDALAPAESGADQDPAQDAEAVAEDEHEIVAPAEEIVAPAEEIVAGPSVEDTAEPSVEDTAPSAYEGDAADGPDADEPDILGEVDPGGFLDDASFDPRDRPTVPFDALGDAGRGTPPVGADVEVAGSAQAARRPSRMPSATFAFSMLALAAVLLALAIAYALDGLPGQDDDSSPTGTTVTSPQLPRDPVPTTPATG